MTSHGDDRFVMILIVIDVGAKPVPSSLAAAGMDARHQPGLAGQMGGVGKALVPSV
jgi:hypothetical protein